MIPIPLTKYLIDTGAGVNAGFLAATSEGAEGRE
jgi:hypothetical protein